MIFLSVPTTAILASNGALPGDPLYPVKTTLESIASKIISPSYQARSDLEIKLIQRRIEENQKLLLSSGSTKGLQLLVAQAEAAKEFILNSNASDQVKKEAVGKLITTLRQSQQTLQQQKDNIAHSNPTAVTKTIYKTETVYVNNSTVSQGNSSTNNQGTNNISETIEDIDETQEDIDEIIDDISQEADSPPPPSFDTPPSTPEPTTISTPIPTPTPTPAPTYSSCQEACEAFDLGDGSCKPNQACFGNVTHNIPGDQFCDSSANKICCCDQD